MAEQPGLARPGLKNPPDRASVSASRPARPRSPEFTFEREDWTLFRSLSTLSQKAGVPVHLLPRLVLKELADNALDAGGTVRVGPLDAGGWYVEDDGPGIAGEPADIARLFSIRRPLVSSKLLRLPTRGALGNGLRVVAGAVLASSGRLVAGDPRTPARAATAGQRRDPGRRRALRAHQPAPGSRSIWAKG